MTLGAHKPHHHIRLTQEINIGVCLDCLQYFSGRPFFLNASFLPGDYPQLYTDAAGRLGYGLGYGALDGAGGVGYGALDGAGGVGYGALDGAGGVGYGALDGA